MEQWDLEAKSDAHPEKSEIKKVQSQPSHGTLQSGQERRAKKTGAGPPPPPGPARPFILSTQLGIWFPPRHSRPGVGFTEGRTLYVAVGEHGPRGHTYVPPGTR